MAYHSLTKELKTPTIYTITAGSDFSFGETRTIGGEFSVSNETILTGIGWNRTVPYTASHIVCIWNPATGALLTAGVITGIGSAVFATPLTLKPNVTYVVGVQVTNTTVISALRAIAPTPTTPLTLGRGLTYTNTTAGIPNVLNSPDTSWYGDIKFEYQVLSVDTRALPPEAIVKKTETNFTISLDPEWVSEANVKEWDLEISSSLDNAYWGDWKPVTSIASAMSYTHTPGDAAFTSPFYRYRYRLRTVQNQETDWSEVTYAGQLINTGGGSIDLPLDGDDIADGSIDQDHISSVNATSIVGSITAAQIGSINAGSIIGTITAGQIGSVNAGSISGLVAAAQIGSVNAGSITGAITSAQIGTVAAGSIIGTVGGSQIAAGSITVAHITVTSISSLSTNLGNITAGTITGGIIQTASTGARVVMDTTGLRGYALNGVTKVFEINAGSGVASFTGIAQLDPASVVPGTSIDGAFIDADSFTVGVFSDNLLINYSAEGSSTNGWALVEGTGGTLTAPAVADAPHGDYVFRLPAGANVAYGHRAIPVRPGAKYSVRVRLEHSNGNGTYFVRMNERSDYPTGDYVTSGNRTSYTDLASGLTNTGITAWTTKEYVFTVPAGIYWVSPSIYNWSVSTGTLDFDAFEMREQITANEIYAGSISANLIQAGAIQAQHLSVSWGGSNVFTNTSFEAPPGANGMPYIGAYQCEISRDNISGNQKFGTYGLKALSSVNGPIQFICDDELVSIAPGDKYVFSVWIKKADGSVRTGWMSPRIFSAGPVYRDQGGAETFSISGSGWQRITSKWTVPSTVYGGYIPTHMGWVVTFNNMTNGEPIWIDGVQVEPGEIATAWRPRVDEMLPGSVGSTQISPDAITTQHIFANTIIGGDIAATTITGTNIAAGTITGTHIAGTTITGDHISATTITGDKIAGNTITGVQISGDAIDGMTITGAFIRTAASGARLEMTTTSIRKILADNTTIPIQIGVANGLDLLVGGSANPGSDQRVRWVTSSGGSTGEMFTYRQGGWTSAIFAVLAEGSGNLSNVGLLAYDSVGSIKARVDAVRDTGSGVNVDRAVVGAGAHSRTVIDTNAASGFMQYAVSFGKRVCSWGTISLTFSNGNSSNSPAIPHGLEVTPAGVQFSTRKVFFGCRLANWDATYFYPEGFVTTGAAVTDIITYDWFAYA